MILDVEQYVVIYIRSGGGGGRTALRYRNFTCHEKENLALKPFPCVDHSCPALTLCGKGVFTCHAHLLVAGRPKWRQPMLSTALESGGGVGGGGRARRARKRPRFPGDIRF